MKSKTKIRDWRERPKELLESNLKELKEKLRVLRFFAAQGKLKNVREIREARKDIARIMTILSQNQKPKTKDTD